jgi:acetyl/propionyl-CoA carboxylase alpha subunit
MVTGIDLAKEQLRVAAGMPLSFRQEEVRWYGSAIECRIYAEDPDNDFLPTTGRIVSYREPSGPGVRVDSGVAEGDQVPIYYDPLIAKLIVWGRTRSEAIARMQRALREYTVAGVKTTIPFHLAVMSNERFVEGRLSTHFIPEEFAKSARSGEPVEKHLLTAMALFACAIDRQRQQPYSCRAGGATGTFSAWKLVGRRLAMEKHRVQ